MPEHFQDVRTLEQLRHLVHRILCEHENILQDQFKLTESQLVQGGRSCGMQFYLQGPRSVQLQAIWASDHNMVYFYDARGARFLKVRLECRLCETAA
jgi:hypothetical protein